MKPVQPIRIHTAVDDLTKGQVKILQCLADGSLLTRTKIQERCQLSGPTVCGLLGSEDPEMRAKAEERWHHKLKDKSSAKRMVSLMTLEYVAAEKLDIDGLVETSYTITQLGLDVLEGKT